MKYELYTVFDVVARESGPIFQQKNHSCALREFERMMSKTPGAEDYKLFWIGQYDTESMVLYHRHLHLEVNADFVAKCEMDDFIASNPGATDQQVSDFAESMK